MYTSIGGSYAFFACASWLLVLNAGLTSSPKLLSPRDSDLSVSFLERASPKDAASAGPKGCPEASSSTREVFFPKALEKAATSNGPNFLVLRMHMVLACFHRRVHVCGDVGECQSRLTLKSTITCRFEEGINLIISTEVGKLHVLSEDSGRRGSTAVVLEAGIPHGRSDHTCLLLPLITEQSYLWESRQPVASFVLLVYVVSRGIQGVKLS